MIVASKARLYRRMRITRNIRSNIALYWRVRMSVTRKIGVLAIPMIKVRAMGILKCIMCRLRDWWRQERTWGCFTRIGRGRRVYVFATKPFGSWGRLKKVCLWDLEKGVVFYEYKICWELKKWILPPHGCCTEYLMFCCFLKPWCFYELERSLIRPGVYYTSLTASNKKLRRFFKMSHDQELTQKSAIRRFSIFFKRIDWA